MKTQMRDGVGPPNVREKALTDDSGGPTLCKVRTVPFPAHSLGHMPTNGPILLCRICPSLEEGGQACEGGAEDDECKWDLIRISEKND